MRRVIDIVPVDFKSLDDQYAPFTIEVQQPAELRLVTTVVRPPSSIIPTSMGRPAEAEAIPIPALVFEVDPDGDKRTRSYLWLAPGVKLTYPGTIAFRATYIDEATRSPMFLYEVLSTHKKGV